MWTYLKTAFAFAKNIKQTGAISQTSAAVEREITRFVSAELPQVVVEFGPGMGNISRRIVAKMHPESQLICIEVLPNFCAALRKEFSGDKRVRIVEGSAADVALYLPAGRNADAIVSAVPLTILPEALRAQMLAASKAVLSEGGRFSQILYSKKMLIRFEQLFSQVEFKRVFNVPLGIVYHCRK